MKLFTLPRSKARTSTILDKIKIARPCPASWEEMAGDDRVRHCSECNLNVYNLSAMTRVEAEQWLLQKEGRLCVRLYRRRDGSVITRDCPHGLRAAMGRATRYAGAVLSALMVTVPAFTQQKALQGAPPVQAAQRNDLVNLIVTVLDPQGAVISGATVQVKTNDGRKIQLRTDGAGNASFTLHSGSYLLRYQARDSKPRVVN